MSTNAWSTAQLPGGGGGDAAHVWTAVAESTADGLLVVGPDRKVLATNARFRELWPLPPDAGEAIDEEELLAVAARTVAEPDAFLAGARAVSADRSRPTRDEILLRDGRVLDRHGTPLFDTDGAFLGWAWHFRDITEQKAVEDDLRRLAETLQASLLPPRPPSIPGLQVATRYRAAHESIAVGGDFYDVFRLRTNDWGVVLGDVCGKGVHAARLTALARYTLRSAATHHEHPQEILGEVNDTLRAEPELGERFATAVYARLEQDVCGAWVTLSIAGHPLPVVVRRAGWVDLRGQPGLVLGLFDDVDVGDDRVGLGPGDSLVLFTDGVTEARNARGEEFGDEALPNVLLASTDASADELADAVIAALVEFSGDALADDVALLVVRVPEDAGVDPEGRLRRVTGVESDALPLPGYQVGEPHWGPTWRPSPPREARLRLDGEPTAAARARRFVTGVLHSWRLSDATGGDIELLTSELVGNAIRHGESPFTVIVRYDGDVIRVEVGDGSPALPRRLQPAPDATGGRGIQIVDEVARDWGVVTTVGGKRVWFGVPAPAE